MQENRQRGSAGSFQILKINRYKMRTTLAISSMKRAAFKIVLSDPLIKKPQLVHHIGVTWFKVWLIALLATLVPASGVGGVWSKRRFTRGGRICVWVGETNGKAQNFIQMVFPRMRTTKRAKLWRSARAQDFWCRTKTEGMDHRASYWKYPDEKTSLKISSSQHNTKELFGARYFKLCPAGLVQVVDCIWKCVSL